MQTCKTIIDVEIRKAVAGQSSALSQLAMRSKSYWPYPKDYLEKCVAAMRIEEEDIKNWPVYVATLGSELAGFFVLKVVKDDPRLDHLWIEPKFIGKGIGRLLFKKAIVEARAMGWLRFRIAAEPRAIRFYEKMGTTQIGEIQSRIKPDLYLPYLECIV